MQFRILGPIEVELEAGRTARVPRRARALAARAAARAPRRRRPSRPRGRRAVGGRGPAARAQRRPRRRVAAARRARRGPGASRRAAATGCGSRRARSTPTASSRASGAGRDELARGEPWEAAETLRHALELWRGPALADVADERFAQPEIARLEDLRLSCLCVRIEADLACGRARRARRRARGRRPRASAARASAPSAHARALPHGPPGGCARGVPGCPPRARRRARDRAVAGAARAGVGDPAPRRPGAAPPARTRAGGDRHPPLGDLRLLPADRRRASPGPTRRRCAPWSAASTTRRARCARAAKAASSSGATTA